MIKRMISLLPAVTLALTAAAAFAASDKPESEQGRLETTRQKLTQAIAAESRPEKETLRDANRLPTETLLFFGFRDNMKVLDLLPGGGYYTRILAPVLREKGELYLAIGTGHLAENLLKEKDYQHVQVVSEKTTVERPEGARYYAMSELNLDVRNLDMVTSFRAHHIFDEADRSKLNSAVYDALKSGGIYAVIDHTRRHNEPETDENRRRLDPVKAIKEIEAAGFDFVDYSPMHYRSTDNLSLEVGDKDVTGQTDRWTLKFVKP